MSTNGSDSIAFARAVEKDMFSPLNEVKYLTAASSAALALVSVDDLAEEPLG